MKSKDQVKDEVGVIGIPFFFFLGDHRSWHVVTSYDVGV
jgi:hypothetical protein